MNIKSSYFDGTEAMFADHLPSGWLCATDDFRCDHAIRQDDRPPVLLKTLDLQSITSLRAARSRRIRELSLHAGSKRVRRHGR
jgi:hypothetical protein